MIGDMSGNNGGKDGVNNVCVNGGGDNGRGNSRDYGYGYGNSKGL